MLVPKLIYNIAMLTVRIKILFKLTYGVLHSYLIFVDNYVAYVKILGHNKRGAYKN